MAAEAPQPALFYVHGGGWVMFSLDTHDRIMREYAGRSGVTVVGIDYTRSPEARFPVALEQIVDVVGHAVQFAEVLGIDATRLALGGDSAGANLSVATALTLRDGGHAGHLKGLLLNYGAYAPELKREDVVRYGGPEYMLTDAEMAYFWDQYLAAPKDGDNPLAAPLKADLHQLPPAFLAIPECDVLTGQSLDLYDRLIEAGVAARAVTYTGASHSFLEAMSIAPIADQALADASLWLRTLLEMPS
jgi:acetyl esterase